MPWRVKFIYVVLAVATLLNVVIKGNGTVDHGFGAILGLVAMVCFLPSAIYTIRLGSGEFPIEMEVRNFHSKFMLNPFAHKDRALRVCGMIFGIGSGVSVFLNVYGLI